MSQKKLAVTDKGLLFLEKYVEIQKMIGAKGNGKQEISPMTPAYGKTATLINGFLLAVST